MKRLIYILSGLCLNIVALATQVNLQPNNTNWHTAMPNDTLYIKEKGQYLIKITQIGKFHFEQTTKDTVDLRIQGNNIKDLKVVNNQPSTDTLNVTFRNLLVYNKHISGSYGETLRLLNDTCNINICFKGENILLNATTDQIIRVTGKTPSLNFVGKEGKTTMSTSGGHYNIVTEVSEEDNITYNFANIKRLSGQAGSYNKSGNVFLYNQQKHSTIINGAATKLYLENSSASYSDIYYQSAPIHSKGKIYLKDCTYTNEPLGNSFIIASDTIFIDESAPGKTFLNCGIGGYRNPMGETIYSRVIVKNATYIRRLTAMADIYNANIDILCVSPQVEDILTHADINVYGGKIGQLTNVVHATPQGSFDVNYKNRVMNIFGGIIGGKNTWTPTGIHLGHTYFYGVPQTGTLLNDTLNLYGGKIQVPKDYSLINFTDNTVINVYHKDNPSKRTQFQFHPKHTPATGDYFNYIALIGDGIVGDSLHWEIGDMKHLVGIKSQAITENQLRCNKKAFRLVYKNSQQPNDSLVIGVSKDSTHYFKQLLDKYDIIHIYPAFKRRITYVHTLDETWTSKDTTYYEGFGKSSLPKVIYAGRTFKGWYTQPEGGVKVDSISHLQMGDITLYTQWGPGQDILYSDFENNRLCNTGAQYVLYYSDDENEIQAHGRPLEGYNTKAMYYNVIKNNGKAIVSLYTRNSYPKDISIYKNAPMVYMDLRSTTGLSFLHQGMSVVLGIGTKASETASKNKFTIPAHEELTLVNIPWGQFSNASTMDLEHVCKLQFQPVDEQGEFWLDNIIFTQGEIYPIEKIKLDTIPSKYLYSKNVDILDIPLPTEKAAKQLYLYAQFTPSDATYQTIAWSSADTTIVKIDENGRVSGISHGQTYIYCQSVMHPEVKDSILVGVSQGGLTYQLHGVSISNQLPETYTYDNPQAIPTPQPINDFYTFHGWHTDSITGAVVDSASFHQFGNLKTHTLYAEFTREIPGAAITILQNRILAVQNPYNYDALKEARYAWQYNNNPLASQSNFVEVGRPIPTGVYNVNIHIDQEMPISLARTIDNSIINNDDTNTNFTLYPNPIKAGQLAYLIGKFDHILLFDLNGMPVETTILNDGIIKAPQETGMYILKIVVKDQTYTLKLIVI